MSVIKFEKPNRQMIDFIAANMREADTAEIWASNHATPIESLLQGWKHSTGSVIVTVDGVPCVMIGLVIDNILTGTGVPWLLGTNGALKHKREFLRLSPPIINKMLDVCPKLYNYVHIDNKHSIDWLKWLGFTICDPVKYGVGGELFHKFYIERS